MRGDQSGNGVVATGMIRVAASNALDREPRAHQRAMFLDRFARVIGTAGREPAVRPQQRPEQVLIPTNEGGEERLHARATSAASRLAASSAAAASSARLGTAFARRCTS